MSWHKICITCPQCAEETSITAVNIAADATIRLDLYCQRCDNTLWWTTGMTKMVQCALTLDQQPAEPLYTEYDKRFMHNVHFTMEEQKLIEGGA